MATNIPVSKLGVNLREIRIRKGFSQSDMANMCGVSSQSYQKWEYGTVHSIREETFDRLKDIVTNDDIVKEYMDPHKFYLDSLGFDLKERRKKMGISQKEAANMCGVGWITYMHWENGYTKYTSKSKFDRIKEVFKIEEAG